MNLFKVPISAPIAVTNHLLIRRLTLADAEDMYAYASRQEVTQYLLWSPHPDREFTHQYLKYILSEYKKGNFYDYAIEYRGENRMIGTVGFTEIDRANHKCEIGYVINPDYRGKGIATEALWALIEYAFEKMDMERVEAHYMVGNDASLRVMEKCHMKREGVFRCFLLVKDLYRDVGVCAILKSEYYALKYKVERDG